ncbi:PAQR family membrane homeostasis protein TrhA [Haloimpatiens massiliensis]|uniref:PAQR family membrane homeostasis protein TrhA n=1 Tax=Haloimpatiens massiliensis TaxID=1658110 RepID=UPI000C845F61|nr:hemolysin III family protein [Haloimpatiens massiliensis]
MIRKMREPVSGLTHLLGVGLSILGLILLIHNSLVFSKPYYIPGFVIFGVSSILLYTASSVYHLLSVQEKIIKVLRRVDHSMIYILIAGTYTPICLIALKGTLSKVLFITIWTLAAVGIMLKIFWFNAPRWLSTLFYVIMGWIAVIAIYPLWKTLSPSGIFWLIAGGLSYTIGAVIYATKRPRIASKIFGFHEIFHLFVMLGSFCHFWMMLKYVMFV